MSGDTVITLVGNLTDAPELRFTPSGAAVANFTVASTPRAFDRQANEWKDQETLFMRCSAWREMAENVAESLTKGTRVIVEGRLKARSYETKEGERRTSQELEVDEIGPSMRYATAKVDRNSRGGGQGGNSYGDNQGGFGGGQQGGYGGGQNFGGNQGGFGGPQGGGQQGGFGGGQNFGVQQGPGPQGGGQQGGGQQRGGQQGGGPQGGGQNFGGQSRGPQGGGQQQDTWGQQSGGQNYDWGTDGGDSEPPF